ncbi:MAG: hypothetical protein HC925_02575 [Coleofasciculaceae cyanobacterium SM2_3_26]|nr:hypothetical protein [Coleofasciculaceae cyanobacterium SM2_3_26]
MRFAILGDLHYSDYASADHAAARDRLFHHFFQQVAATQPDLVFAVGDVTNLGTMTELVGLQAVATDCGISLINVVGNHDAWNLDKQELAPFFLGGRPSANSPSANSGADLYTSFEVGSIHFALLDTTRSQEFGRNCGGFVSQAQLDWLGDRVEECDRSQHLQWLMVIGHHALHNTTRRSTRPMSHVENSEALWQVMSKLQRNRGCYWCGHNHDHSIHHPEGSAWYCVQTADPLDCKSFRLVEVGDTELVANTVDFCLEDAQLQADFETVRQNIAARFKPQLFESAYGTASDRRLTVRHSAKLGTASDDMEPCRA